MYRDEEGSLAADRYRDQMNERYGRSERFDAGGYYERGDRERDDDRDRDDAHGYGRRAMHGRDYSRSGEEGRPRYERDAPGRYDADDRGYGAPTYSRREHAADYGRSDYNRGYNRGDDYDRTPGYDRDRDPGDRSRGAYGPAGNYSRSGYGRNEFDADADYGRGYGASMHGRRGAWEEQDRSYGSGVGRRGDDSFAVPGPHAGTGPQGYTRSTDRIREDVCERLTHHGHIDASGITVKTEGDEVTLEGTVDSRRTKRMAEDAAASVAGVHDVHNRLRVRRQGSGDGDSQGDGGGAQGSTGKASRGASKDAS